MALTGQAGVFQCIFLCVNVSGRSRSAGDSLDLLDKFHPRQVDNKLPSILLRVSAVSAKLQGSCFFCSSVFLVASMLRRGGRRSGGERRKNTPERSVKPQRVVHTADHERGENTSSKSAIAQLTCSRSVQVGQGSGTIQADEVRALDPCVRKTHLHRPSGFVLLHEYWQEAAWKVVHFFSLKPAVTQHRQTRLW